MWSAFSLLLALVAADEHVHARLAADAVKVSPGASFRIAAEIRIDDGWHVYAHDFEGVGVKSAFTPALPDGFTMGAIAWPKARAIDSFGEPAEVYEGTVVVGGSVAVAPTVKPGKYELRARLETQSCNDKTCDLQRETELSVTVDVEAGAAPGANEPELFAKLAAAPATARPSGKLAGSIVKAPEKYRIAPAFEISASTLAPGETATVTARLAIEPGWHTYAPGEKTGKPVAFAKPEGFELVGGIEGPEPTVHVDPQTHEKTLLYAGDVTLRQRVRATAGRPGGDAPALTFEAMACDDSHCDPPAKWTVRFPIVVAGAAKPSAAEPTSDLTLGAFLGLAAGGGAASLFTPCVFPMVPITVSFFSKRASGKRGRTVKLAVVYALGIVLTFTLIGVVVSALFGATGLNAFAANIWVNLGLGALFVAMGLSLLGLFQIGAPSGLVNKVATAQLEAKGDVSLTLLMAVAFTLTSFTCTLPILAVLLGAAAKGEVLRPTFGMLAYSATFAAPFFALALFPAVLQKLPRGGAWLERVKVSMGLVEIAAAMKFLSNADIGANAEILTRPVFIAIWVALFGALALYLFGVLRLPGAEGEVGPIAALFGVGAASLALYLFAGLFGTRFGGFLEAFLPPPDYGVVRSAVGARGERGEPNDELVWNRDLDAALAQATREKKRVFLDFTGFQCVNCRAMEQTVFRKPEVIAELKRFVLVQLHLDAQAPEAMVLRSTRYRALQLKMFDTNSMPFYAIVESDGTTVVATFPDGYTTKVPEFVAFLKKG